MDTLKYEPDSTLVGGKRRRPRTRKSRKSRRKSRKSRRR